MDRIIKITLALFFTILIGTIVFTASSVYVSDAYRSTRVSEFTYSCSITTDSALTNVTLFIPVPADRNGNSPIVSQFSARDIKSVPESWQTTLFDTGKATLVKVYIPSLVPPQGTTPANPYTVTIGTTVYSEDVIDTADPVVNSAVYRPVQDSMDIPCDSSVTIRGGSPVCSTYLTSLYADYLTSPEAAVTISSSISGTNTWSVFGTKSNEYSTGVTLLLHGENHGWATMKGTLERRMGSYEYPFQFS